jgi:hypothetical protein
VLTDVSPVAHSDRCDRFGLSDELSAGGAGGVDDGVVVLEDSVREPVLPQILPDVFDRVQFRGARRQEDRRDVFGHVELAGRVPSGPVEDENGVGAFGDVARDFVEVELHHVGVGVRQGEGRSDAAGGTDRAEQIGVVVALVGGLPWPRSAPGPLPDLAVLLADAGLVLKPDFDRRRLRQAFEVSLQRARKVFLNASTIRSSWAGWRGRALMWEKPSFCRSFPT